MTKRLQFAQTFKIFIINNTRNLEIKQILNDNRNLHCNLHHSVAHFPIGDNWTLKVKSYFWRTGDVQ